MPRIIESNREEYKEQARNKIINATIIVMKKKGYQSMTIKDIAEEIGVTKATIYLYFKNKDELINSVLAEGSKHFEEIVAISFEDSDNLDTALEKMVVRTMNFQDRFGKNGENIAFVADMLSMIIRDPVKYSAYMDIYKKNISSMENGLKNLQKKQLISKNIDLHEATFGILALIMSIKFWAFFGEDRDFIKRYWISCVKKILTAPQ